VEQPDRRDGQAPHPVQHGQVSPEIAPRAAGADCGRELCCRKLNLHV
jgi:hypothetical protein